MSDEQGVQQMKDRLARREWNGYMHRNNEHRALSDMTTARTENYDGDVDRAENAELVGLFEQTVLALCERVRSVTWCGERVTKKGGRKKRSRCQN